MLFKDLFKRDNVKFPNWLPNRFLEDKWLDSNYYLRDGVHTWVLKSEFEHLEITCDDKELHFKCFDEDGSLMFDNITTEEFEMVC